MRSERTRDSVSWRRALGLCLVSGLALWGCEEGEVKSAVEPITTRCEEAKTAEDWDSCVTDLAGVAEKHPDNTTAQCTYHGYASKALQACNARATSQILSDPTSESIAASIDQCEALFKSTMAVCERCRDLGGSKYEGPPKCDGEATNLKEAWTEAKDKKQKEDEQKRKLEEEKKKLLAFCDGDKDAPAVCHPKKARARAPATFKVRFETTKGAFVLEAHRAWAPLGVDRFYNLVKMGYYEDIALFRVMEGFMVQFGIHGAPPVAKRWKEATIRDDKPRQSNTRGMVSYAKAGPHSRTVQLFINFVDNSGGDPKLDAQGFAPIGKVVEGMDVVDSFYKDYNKAPQRQAQKIVEQGNVFLKKTFPKLDYIKSAKIL